MKFLPRENRIDPQSALTAVSLSKTIRSQKSSGCTAEHWNQRETSKKALKTLKNNWQLFKSLAYSEVQATKNACTRIFLYRTCTRWSATTVYHACMSTCCVHVLHKGVCLGFSSRVTFTYRSTISKAHFAHSSLERVILRLFTTWGSLHGWCDKPVRQECRDSLLVQA